MGHCSHYLSSVIVNVLERFPIGSKESSPCINMLTFIKDLEDTDISYPSKMQMHLNTSH